MSRFPPVWLGVAVVLVGCPTEEPDDDDDTTADAECEEGFVDDAGTCVPEACGVGRWGDLEPPDGAVYVDGQAGEGGDGSRDAPLTSIGAGLERAAQGGAPAVVVAAGSYAENLELTSDHDGLHLQGRCLDLVELDGSPDALRPALLTDVAGGALEVSGLTIARSSTAGVWRVRGGLSLHDVLVQNNRLRGVFAEGGADLTLTDVVIRNTTMTEADDFGYGLVVYGGGKAEVTAVVIDGAVRTGLLVVDPQTEVHLLGVTIRNVDPIDAEGLYGYGIVVDDGATLTGDEVWIERATRTGVVVRDPGSLAQLCDLTVVETRTSANEEWGLGVSARNHGRLEICGGLIQDNANIGVYLYDEGEAELEDVEVSDTRCGEDDRYGRGALVASGAHLVARESRFLRNHQTGLKVTGLGSRIELEEVEVADTEPNTLGEHGAGIYVYDGGELVATDTSLRNNTTIGLQLNWLDSTDPDAAETTATLTGVTIADTRADAAGEWGYGLQLSDGASVVLDGCTLQGNRGAALVAVSEGTEVTWTDTVVADTELEPADLLGFGVKFIAGADGSLTGGALERNGTIGLLVIGEGCDVLAEGLAIRDTRSTADGFGRGVEVSEGAQLTMRDCLLERNADAGIMVFNEDTHLVLEDVTVLDTARVASRTAAVGVACEMLSSVEASGLHVEGTDGPGLHALLSELSCSGCTIRDNRFAGVVARSSAEVTLVQCTIEDNGVDANEGGGVGVFAWEDVELGTPRLALEDSVVQDHDLAAVWLDGWGSHQLLGNQLEGGAGALYTYPDGGTLLFHGNAVFGTGGLTAWDAGSGFGTLLQGNTIHDCPGAAVQLHNASVTLDGNTFTGNALDLHQQACDGVPPPEGVEEAPTSTLCPGYGLLVKDLEFRLDFEEIGPGA